MSSDNARKSSISEQLDKHIGEHRSTEIVPNDALSPVSRGHHPGPDYSLGDLAEQDRKDHVRGSREVRSISDSPGGSD